MGQKQTGKFCGRCNENVLAFGTKPNHILHLILTICTAGLWAFVWAFVTFTSVGGYRCNKCGARV